MVLVVVVSSSKPISDQTHSINRGHSQLGKPESLPLKKKVIKFQSKAANMGFTGILAAQFLISHGNLLNELRELQKNYEDIKISYKPTSASPMKSLVNNKFYEIPTMGHRKILPRRSTHNKSTKPQHKRPKSFWEFMKLRG